MWHCDPQNPDPDPDFSAGSGYLYSIRLTDPQNVKKTEQVPPNLE
jgi:hypothetical protein